jgi:antitoxin component YwqK of YwqJK toxin-antitoxin module
MKKAILFFLLISNIVSAQDSEVRKVYLDSLFKEIESTEGAYYRVVEDENSQKEEYNFKIFYKSGKIYKEGKTRSATSLLESGLITLFYENGNKKEQYSITKGNLYDTRISWYENGVKKSVKEYYKEKTDIKSTEKILQFWNPDNVQKVIDGNGFFEDEENGCYEKGILQNGVRVGKWEGNDTKFHITFKEEYENGKLINGVSIDSSGLENRYTIIQEGAKPRKGYEHFYNYIGKKFKFNKTTEGISGKIILSFVVEKDGSISDIRILRSAGEGLDNESIRLIKAYPDWEPGKYRGKNARILFSIPITIKDPH